MRIVAGKYSSEISPLFYASLYNFIASSLQVRFNTNENLRSVFINWFVILVCNEFLRFLESEGVVNLFVSIAFQQDLRVVVERAQIIVAFLILNAIHLHGGSIS